MVSEWAPVRRGNEAAEERADHGACKRRRSRLDPGPDRRRLRDDRRRADSVQRRLHHL